MGGSAWWQEAGRCPLAGLSLPRSGDLDDPFCSPPSEPLGCRGTEERLTPQGREAGSLSSTLAHRLSLPGLCLSQPLGLELGAGSQERLGPLTPATSKLDSFLKRYRWDRGTQGSGGGHTGCPVSCFPLACTAHIPTQRKSRDSWNEGVMRGLLAYPRTGMGTFWKVPSNNLVFLPEVTLSASL